MQVSVIATVLNEAQSIEALLEALQGQTRAPDEVVIVDGGSTDDTVVRIQRFCQQTTVPIRVLSQPGCNISQGRNAAIRAAQYALIAAIDAGARPASDWLEKLVAPFEHANAPDVVGGFFVSDPQSTFELALGLVTLPLVEEIDPTRFYPSSRSVAFRRTAWQAVGGYPEWLDYCEDLVFDFALRDAGFAFAFQPEAVVYFRPRSSLRAFFRQYYRYARGDGKANLWLVRHLVRYATYLLVLPALVALAIWHHPLWGLGLVAGGAAMLRRPWQRLTKLTHLSASERWRVLCWMPIIRLTGDIAKMLGYPVGLCWRRKHAPKRPTPRRWV